MRDGRLTPYFLLTGRQCSGKMELRRHFQEIFAHFTPIILGGRASFWPLQAGFTGRPWSGICIISKLHKKADKENLINRYNISYLANLLEENCNTMRKLIDKRDGKRI
jgi:hypothetical protein